MTVLDNLGWGPVRAGGARGTVAGLDVAAPTGVGLPPGFSLRTVLVLADVLAVFVAWALLKGVALEDVSFGPWIAGASLAALVALACLTSAGLYRSRVSSVRAIELARLPRVACLSAAAGLVAAAHLDDRPLPLVHVLAGAVVSACTLVFARGTFDAYMRQARTRGRYCRSLVLVGGGAEAAELRDRLAQHPELGFRLAGRVGSADDEVIPGVEVLGPVDELLEITRRSGANGVVITAAAMSETDRTPLVNRLLAAGLHVHVSAGLRGLDPRRLQVVPIAHEPLFYVEPATLQPYQLRVKRVFDVVVAALAIVLLSPVLAVAALAIKVHDHGPVLFRQTRVGRHGKTFTCLKLRTMRVGAELEQAVLDNDRRGPLFKSASDPRVTRVGRFLRISSIDELPQLFNVLRGEMSLVGPRPALPEEVAQFDSELLRRLDVPPGLSGIWQVEARDVPAFDAYRRLDLYYVENWRFGLDVIVLVLTAQVVVSRIIRHVVRRHRDELVVGAGEVQPVVLD
jgi:exopolysaccharide biosynthesis polyprenyl glycosylphosphotransferase